MRLLKLDSNGSFGLVEFTGDVVPPYAILSHTWGADAEEVTFHEVAAGLGQHKSGYRKLVFCGTQALQDGLSFFWVDTCCIDKSSSAELTEAINSMFRWYQEAARCYAYLSDVCTGISLQHQQQIENSTWFRRGWTLQELLAPKSVLFYSAEGTLLGSRASLLQEIEAATGICSSALQGEPLHQFSVETRLSWAEGRVTKRAEDAAYCLLGIFDVNLPLIYGEGRRKAFIRLHREIRDSIRSQTYPPYQVPSITSTGAAPSRGASTDLRGLSFVEPSSLQHIKDSTQRLLDSLYYNGLEERQHQVREAQIGTYEWILYPQLEHSASGNSFTQWLSSPLEAKRIYWICGKPGSGKSTMMRFIHDNIDVRHHLEPWACNKIIFRAQYFFWNPGSEMQKSIVGLLRALLYQLISQLRLHRPMLIPEIVDRALWTANITADNAAVYWIQRDLQITLHKVLRCIRTFGTVFFLIDGLDELSGTDETRDELLHYLFDMANLDHVKICLSSRPWNSFRDAFQDYPYIRLEDVTHNDIKLFIEAQLSSQVRFRHMLHHQQHSAEQLMAEISERASGVFLWVRLVVRQLLARIRDGDGINKLSKQLDLIPGDLNCYMKQMFDSIPLERRYESSVILQIALYEESDFATLHPLYLLDLSFHESGQACFLLSKDHDFDSATLTERNSLSFCLDSTLRLLNSCCMGLLECYHLHEDLLDVDDEDVSNTSLATKFSENILDTEEPKLGKDVEHSSHFFIAQYGLHEAKELRVDFFHRTCRDFLLTPDIQALLHEQSQGPFDAQMYLVNARICQFVAMTQMEDCHHEAMELASNIVSSLARPAYRDSKESAYLAALFETSFETLMRVYDAEESSASYIMTSVESWESERSSFMTLSIDFGLRSYLRGHLTSQYIRDKEGRPVLDYILRPRFLGMRKHMSTGNSEPDLEFLRTVLSMGADPNEAYQASSVWALYLCLFADLITHGLAKEQISVYAAALGCMIQAGASTSIPKSWLSARVAYDCYLYMPLFQENSKVVSNNDRFAMRWPGIENATDFCRDAPHYAVRDLLERFRPQLGTNVDDLKALLH
ncbi:hypothetical protein B5807_08368 [Epicoccum nigrum]|uniref:NACHT domain-containing protein n=1 Tax=Epicoccum nigrum TaxID=105696 RepID=A0A1Y2LQR5_EPING|nr:hypothetical protein B5807_08368 [Epicoccum nigrum]